MKINLIFLLIIIHSITFFSQSDDLHSRYLLAKSYLDGGEADKAAGILKELYTQQPENVQFFESYHKALVELKRYDEAISLIEKKLESTPDNVALIAELGSDHYLAGNEDKAFEIWDDAVSKFSTNTSAIRIIANTAIERRAFDKAIEILEAGKKITDNPVYFSFDIANLYSVTFRFTEAAEEYCSILEKNENQIQIVESRILSYINKPGALESTIEVFSEYDNTNNLSFLIILARLYIEAGDYNKALNIYLRIDELRNGNGTDLLNFASFLFNEKHYAFAVDAYRNFIERYPESLYTPEAKIGELKSYEEQFYLDNRRNSELWKDFPGVTKYNSDELNSIINRYEIIITDYPDTEVAAESYLRLGKIYAYILNNNEKAAYYFRQAISCCNGTDFAVQARKELGLIAIRNGNIENAEQIFTDLYSNSLSADSKYYYAFRLAEINFFGGKFDKSKEYLDFILQNLKTNAANDAIELSLLLNTAMNDSSKLVKFAEAELLLAGKKFEEAIKIYNSVQEGNPGILLKNIAEFRQAQVLTSLNRFDEAIVILDSIAAQGEKNIYADKALYLKAKIYQYGLNDLPNALKSYEQLLEKFPGSLYLEKSRAAILDIRNKMS
ncbi:MAG: hypothetical protein Kow0098_01100 [Ignavibacteriaceae bacterium]